MMFQLLKRESAPLARAIALADAMAKERGHPVYVVHLCDDDYDVTAQVPRRYEYKTCRDS